VRGELERYDARSKTLEPFLSGISAQDVAFSKDGKWIAYVSFPEGTLWRSKLDGSDRLQLSFAPLYAMVPCWSPDGKQLAFSIMTHNVWDLGLVNADGSGFRFVKNAELKSEAFGAPAWARDGKSIFCHDLENIYHIDLDGNVLKKWELSKILTDASMNSGNRLSISPDGNALLMDVDCGSEHERKNWDGPQPAIEKLDLSAEKAVRITGKDDYVWEPFWLTANELLCIMQKENEKQASIYRMSLDGKNPKLLVKDARTPSASAP
jgi:TolB protein